MNSKRLLILTGAGFPITWGSPSSNDLLNTVKNTINLFNDLNDDLKQALLYYNANNNLSFESILSVLEKMICLDVMKSNNFYEAHFMGNIFSFDYQILCELYKSCINNIIAKIGDYEKSFISSNNDQKALFEFWKFIKNSYSQINYYTLNYDEIPQLLFNQNDFDYFDNCMNMHNQNSCNFVNLHGSIHLKLKFESGQYELTHSDIPNYLSSFHYNYGGNPNEHLFFSPIITGHSKAQRILDKHFFNNFVLFAQDLLLCDTILIIGYSFLDPHINVLLREYTKKSRKKLFFIDYQSVVSDSNYEANFNNVVIPRGTYCKDSENDDFFYYNNPSLTIYKRGFKSFLENKELWNIDKI